MPTEIPHAIADASAKIRNLQRQTFRQWTVGVAFVRINKFI
jgi:hypothetical protein